MWDTAIKLARRRDSSGNPSSTSRPETCLFPAHQDLANYLTPGTVQLVATLDDVEVSPASPQLAAPARLPAAAGQASRVARPQRRIGRHLRRRAPAATNARSATPGSPGTVVRHDRPGGNPAWYQHISRPRTPRARVDRPGCASPVRTADSAGVATAVEVTRPFGAQRCAARARDSAAVAADEHASARWSAARPHHCCRQKTQPACSERDT